MKLYEVKIQDPDTKEWFDKTQDKLEYYYSIFNKKYFNNELPTIPVKPMNFREAKSSINLGITDTIYHVLEHSMTYVIKVNKDYISTFEELRIVLVHEMIHVYSRIKTNITTKQWNAAYNYIKYCNDTNTVAEITKVDKLLGFEQELSHEGIWLEKATELNETYSEFNNDLTEYYNCTVDEDSYETEIKNIHCLLRIQDNEYTIFTYTNENEDSYNNLMSIIKRGTSKQIKTLGEWYNIELKKDNIFDFISKYANKSCNINNYDVFKNLYIEKQTYLNNVTEIVDESFWLSLNSFDITVRL